MDPPPDSSTSSPRATTDNSLDDHGPPPPQQPTQKLRLMCSYGGHIVPRPHDKSLCYVGGDTRIVVVDRPSATLPFLTSRLSSTLLNGRPFTLKYQLPNEDLDSLISVTGDEDLENMLEEYDRTTANSSSSPTTTKPVSRLRLFLFPSNPESTQSLLDNGVVKNDDWFFNALNGTHLNRGFSDSAASSVNCLLGLDDPLVGGGGGSDGNNREVEGLSGNNSGNKCGAGVKQDVQSVPDSPMMETTSSFGSTSSSPSLANLPPIKVHVEDHQKAVVGGIEEQFSQISVGGGGGEGLKQDEGFLIISEPPPMPVSIVPMGLVGGGVGEYRDRVYSDDERSDHGGGVPVLGGGYRKRQQQQVPPPQRLPSSQELGQLKSSGGGVVDLPSPDSVSRDGSFSNAMNPPKPVVSQESVMQIPSLANRVAPNLVDQKTNLPDLGMHVPVEQVQDSGYVLQPQFDQQLQQQQPQQTQQFMPSGAHYIHHYPGGAVPISAYYPVYSPQQQQQHQQYQVYYVPARPQAYNLNLQQSSIGEAGTTIPSSPQTLPNATMVPPTSAYNPARNAPVLKPEMATAGMYRTATTGTPQFVQVPSSQHQQQYVAYSQVHHPTQSVAPSSTGTGNYAYEFVDPAHAQVYYTQPLAPTIPAQYQTGAAALVVPEASAQLSVDNIKQQIRTSQPM